jgi:hypothetical protein
MRVNDSPPAPAPDAASRRSRKRPVPCDAAARGRFVAGLARGLPAVRAAAAAGCSIATFNKRRLADARFDLACAKAARGGAWAERAPGPPTRCDAAAKLAFLAGLAEGLTLNEAAARAGCALSTFYWNRCRDPLFLAAWNNAAEAAVAGRPAGARKPRRLRFDAARRARFLAALGEDCCTSGAARRVPIDASAVYRRLQRDPDFARANGATLQAGYARLERLAEAELEAAAARLAASADTRHEREVPPPGDFDTIMRLLARYDRPLPKPRRDGSRPRPAMSHFELIEALGRRLEKRFPRPSPEQKGKDRGGGVDRPSDLYRLD